MRSVRPLLALHHPLPNIWGEGTIFAFSGFDGPTCSASNFVLTFGREPYDLLIQTTDTSAAAGSPPPRRWSASRCSTCGMAPRYPSGREGRL